MLEMRTFNEEVFFTGEDITRVGPAEIQFLKDRAGRNKRRRARLCAHADVAAAVHEMFIVLGKDVYIRPHKHTRKNESFHMIEGLVDIVLFNEQGEINELVRVGGDRSSEPFYFRIREGVYHTVLIASDWIVFHETTSGPFDRAGTQFATWAPEEDAEDAEEYRVNLAARVAARRGRATVQTR